MKKSLRRAVVQYRDNLFRINQSAVQKVLMEKFPYIEGVRLKRSFPPKLTLEITQAKPLGAVNTGAGYVVIGYSGKILETGVRALPADVTVVNGMYLSLAEVGHRLGDVVSKGDLTYSRKFIEMEVWRREKATKAQCEARDKEKSGARGRRKAKKRTLKCWPTLLRRWKKPVSERSRSSTFRQLNMRIVYDGRILIELGSEADLPYKLKFVSG
jgi:hypothetical protein